MIYLQGNPLLREPLKPEHIKSRLLGHWGSSPGLSFLYIHLSRLIKKYDQEMYIHGRTRPWSSRSTGAVLSRGRVLGRSIRTRARTFRVFHEFFKQFSFPGGIGSHCTPETPGSKNEGGELGYVLSHALRRSIRQSQAAATPEQKARLQEAISRRSASVGTGRGTNSGQADFGTRQLSPHRGIKVVARSGWFAARPSGTENIYKIYAERFESEAHLATIVSEAQSIVDAALGAVGVSH